MDVPDTVATALADRTVAGTRCLEAGAGVGNTTAGLLAEGAARVYAVTDDRDHARTTRRHVEDVEAVDDRLAVLEADLRSIPLPDGSVDLITAHGLCNVLDPAALATVARELSRVAAPGSELVVDDYDPLPDDAAMNRLFAVENAASELAVGRAALTFYPAGFLRRLFESHEWAFERETTLLKPVPWTENHVSAHAEQATSTAEALPDDVGDALAATARRTASEIGSESTGRMYGLAFRLPG